MAKWEVCAIFLLPFSSRLAALSRVHKKALFFEKAKGRKNCRQSFALSGVAMFPLIFYGVLSPPAIRKAKPNRQNDSTQCTRRLLTILVLNNGSYKNGERERYCSGLIRETSILPPVFFLLASQHEWQIGRFTWPWLHLETWNFTTWKL